MSELAFKEWVSKKKVEKKKCLREKKLEERKSAKKSSRTARPGCFLAYGIFKNSQTPSILDETMK